MLTGKELYDAMLALPGYDPLVRAADPGTRLEQIENLYQIYVPSEMSEEIYSRIYLAVRRSVGKKNTREAVLQYKRNFGLINGKYTGAGVIGGSDSFSIIGKSGIGKSAAILRSVQLLDRDEGIVPVVLVQTPQDCSVKSLLLEILREIDVHLGSKYWEKAQRSSATVDMLIGSVSQIALNHIGLIIVDEIQNVAQHKNGRQLVGMLTQLINNSGVSICMVGTPECKQFFRSTDYLARRAVGLEYYPCEYNAFFVEFCDILFQYQYTARYTELTDDIVYWLYEQSGGIVSNVVKILAFSQEYAILRGMEELNAQTLAAGADQLHRMVNVEITPIKATGHKKAQDIPLAELPVDAAEIDIVAIIRQAKVMERDIAGELAKVMEVREI